MTNPMSGLFRSPQQQAEENTRMAVRALEGVGGQGPSRTKDILARSLRRPNRLAPGLQCALRNLDRLERPVSVLIPHPFDLARAEIRNAIRYLNLKD